MHSQLLLFPASSRQFESGGIPPGCQVKFTMAAFEDAFFETNRRSIYQFSYMVQRLSAQPPIFGVVFFLSKSFLGVERQRKL